MADEIIKSYDLTEARKAVGVLFSRVRFGDGECIEVRCFGKKQRLVASGWFDDLDLLAKAVCRLAKNGHRDGYRFVQESVYWTCNPANDALLSRQTKNTIEFVSENTVDHDITRRLWLPIDIDPIRTSGVSATNEERKLALTVANCAIDKLISLGFNENSLVGGTSGNGYHVLVAVDQPNDEDTKNLFKRCLTALQACCGNSRVDIDLKVFNAARILKAYGTLARKGNNDDKRPWRMSKLTIVPEQPLEPASRELLQKLADLAPTKDTKRAINEPASGGMTPDKAQKILDDADIDADSSPENYQYSDDDNVQHTALKWKHRCLIDPDNHGKNTAFSLLENGWLNHCCMHKNTHEGMTQAGWRKAWEERTQQKYPRMFPERPIEPNFEVDYLESDEDKIAAGEDPEKVVAENVAEAAAEVEEERGEIPKYNRTDLGNSERLLWRYGTRFRHSNKRGWYYWSKTHWKPDADKYISAAAKITVRKIQEEAAEWVNELAELDREDEANKSRIKILEALINAVFAWALASESRSKQSAMIGLTETSLSIDIDVEIFDADPLLFNVKNGTIDLRTGELRPHRKDDYLTNLSPVIFDTHAECPLWLEFLADITNGDQELIAYLQRAVGYSMTGLTEEHCLFLLHGIGRNGKSTFLEVVQAMLGVYSLPANMDMFLVKKQDGGIPNDLASLHKTRMVTAVESDDGKRLSEAKIKQITGGDTITARFLHKEFFSFKPQFKIWLATNHLPVITGQDEGIWRRIKRVPFNVVIPESKVDETLTKKLKSELSGILNWALKGLEDYRLNGLEEPSVVTAATQEYRGAQDWLARFLGECTEGTTNIGEIAQARQLYNRYVEWAKATGEYVLREVKFGEAMALAGHPSKRMRRGEKVIRGYEGMRVCYYNAAENQASLDPELEDRLMGAL